MIFLLHANFNILRDEWTYDLSVLYIGIAFIFHYDFTFILLYILIE